MKLEIDRPAGRAVRAARFRARWLFLAVRAGNMSSSIALSDTYEASARFDNIGGLKPRAAVRSAGVVVGRVTAIRFDDKAYQAEVTLALDRRYQFPKDSSAEDPDFGSARRAVHRARTRR